MENQTQLIILIIISCIAMISPATAIIALFSFHKRRMSEKEAKIQQIEHEKQIENYKSVVEASELEREKIAKNLHDSIIPKLSVIKSSLDMNAVDYATGKYNLVKLQDDILVLEQTIVEVRGVSHDLVPPVLALSGVISALEGYVRYSDNSATEQINFEDRTTFGETLPFPMQEQHNIYRICLELLHNLKKYANYNTLHIILENDDNSLRIEFIHDGEGITNEQIEVLTNSSKGLGLKSLQSRVQILNASIDYSFDSHTAGVLLIIPFKENKSVESHSI